MGLQDQLKEDFGDEPDKVDPEDAFTGPNLDTPLKPGEYLFEIVADNTEMQDTSGGGEQLNFDLKVVEPTFSGRRIFPSFQVDCPKNRSFEKEERERVLSIWQATGGEGVPSVEDFHGRRFVGTTGLEWNDYKDGEWQATLWGVQSVEEGSPPEGPWPDDEQSERWEKAVELAKQRDGDGDGDAGAMNAQGGPKTESFDEDELGF